MYDAYSTGGFSSRGDDIRFDGCLYSASNGPAFGLNNYKINSTDSDYYGLYLSSIASSNSIFVSLNKNGNSVQDIDLTKLNNARGGAVINTTYNSYVHSSVTLAAGANKIVTFTTDISTDNYLIIYSSYAISYDAFVANRYFKTENNKYTLNAVVRNINTQSSVTTDVYIYYFTLKFIG